MVVKRTCGLSEEDLERVNEVLSRAVNHQAWTFPPCASSRRLAAIRQP